MGVLGGVDFSGGEGEGVEDGLFFGGGELEAVGSEKCVSGHETAALVAGKERVILDDAMCVSGGHFGDGRVFVMEQLLGSGQRGFEQRFVAHPGQAAEPGDERGLDGKHDLARDPDGFVHLANSQGRRR